MQHMLSSHNMFILYGQNEPKAGQGEPRQSRKRARHRYHIFHPKLFRMPHRQNLRFLHCIAVRNAYACTLNSSSSQKVHFVGAFWEPYRVPGRCWANANIVWDKGATAYKCEGVTNRNTKHKRRVVTLRGTSR